jgi:hypothetical protein
VFFFPVLHDKPQDSDGRRTSEHREREQKKALVQIIHSLAVAMNDKNYGRRNRQNRLFRTPSFARLDTVVGS